MLKGGTTQTFMCLATIFENVNEIRYMCGLQNKIMKGCFLCQKCASFRAVAKSSTFSVIKKFHGLRLDCSFLTH